MDDCFTGQSPGNAISKPAIGSNEQIHHPLKMHFDLRGSSKLPKTVVWSTKVFSANRGVIYKDFSTNMGVIYKNF